MSIGCKTSQEHGDISGEIRELQVERFEIPIFWEPQANHESDQPDKKSKQADRSVARERDLCYRLCGMR